MLAVTVDYAPLIDVVVGSSRAYTTKTRHKRKLTLFFEWWAAAGRPVFCRDTVQQYMAEIATQAAFQRLHSLAAIKRLATEAFYRGLIDHHTLTGITNIEAPRVLGSRQGNRLSAEEITAAIRKPDASTLLGKRDRLALALLFYAGLRRYEAAAVTVAHLKYMEGRPVIANLVGKGERVRTVPIPGFVMDWAQEWIALTGIDGVLLRSVNRWGQVSNGLSGTKLLMIAKQYAGVGCHDLRRTMGSLARRAGMELDQIQQVYGHSSVSTTQGYIGGTLNLRNAVCDVLPKGGER